MILQKQDHHEIELWLGFRNKISLCCILFYESVWKPKLKNEINEYMDVMYKLTNNQGIILCPECLMKKVCKVETIEMF